MSAGEEPFADAPPPPPGADAPPPPPGADAPPPPPAGVSVAPGWYSVDQERTSQAYWDGQNWSKTRRWRGTGWVDDSAESIPAGAAAVFSSSYAALTRPPRDQSIPKGPPSPPTGGYHPTPGPVRPVAQATNGLAIASLVLSLLGLFGIGSLLGIIFGYKARREIRESRGSQSGDGLALAGIIIGFVTLVVFALVLAFWIAAFATIRSAEYGAASSQQTQVAQCQADVRVVDVALAAYHADTGSFPVPTYPWSAVSYTGNYGPLTTGTRGNTFLRGAPSTTEYVVEYDSAGNVWVAPPNSYEQSYSPEQDIGVNADACQNAVDG